MFLQRIETHQENKRRLHCERNTPISIFQNLFQQD